MQNSDGNGQFDACQDPDQMSHARQIPAAVLVFATSILLIVLQAASVAAEPVRTGRAAEAGLSQKKLDAALADYRKVVDSDKLRGAVLLVARRGIVALHEPLGWRNKAAGQPMRTDTIFRMASNTKAAIATGVLQLVESGTVALDDPIGRHLPAFDNARCSKITVRHLLSHTSGLRIKSLFLPPLRKKSPQYPLAPNLQLEVDRFADVGPEVGPGTSYSYNNPGYNTLAALIEVKSGQPVDEYLARHVYRPLGMIDTSHRPPKDRLSRMAVVYERIKPKPTDSKGTDPTPGWRVRFDQSGKMRVPFVRGSGGLVSTSSDFLRFCQMFLGKGRLGEIRVLKPGSVAEATRPQTASVYPEQERGKRNSFYGLGWVVRRTGVYGHGGSEGTYAFVDPRHELVVLVFTQSPGGTNPRDAFFDAVVAAVIDE